RVTTLGLPGCPPAATICPFSSSKIALDSLEDISSESAAVNRYTCRASMCPAKSGLPSASTFTSAAFAADSFKSNVGAAPDADASSPTRAAPLDEIAGSDGGAAAGSAAKAAAEFCSAVCEELCEEVAGEKPCASVVAAKPGPAPPSGAEFTGSLEWLCKRAALWFPARIPPPGCLHPAPDNAPPSV